MNRPYVSSNTFLQLQDLALSRARACGEELARSASALQILDGAAPPPPRDARVLAAWCRDFAGSLAEAWNGARCRRHALKQLKRVDRRLLVDIGTSRAQLREFVDSMNAAREAQAAQAAPPPVAGVWVAGDAVA